jgi:hypothetical protein
VGAAFTLVFAILTLRRKTNGRVESGITVDSPVTTAAIPLPATVTDTPSQKSLAQWRGRVGWILGIASFGLLITAAIMFQSDLPGDMALRDAPLALLIGGAGLILALWLRPLPIGGDVGATRQALAVASTDVRMTGARGLVLALGVLYMLALLIVNVRADHISTHLQFLALCATIACLLWGFGMRIPRRVSWEVWAVIGITALAFVVRAAALDSALRFFIDEVNFSHGVLRWIRGGGDAPLLDHFDGIASFPWIYTYLEATAVTIFGRNLIGLRIVSTIFGALTVPSLYLLARALFDRPAAFAAALILATLPPHLHFSRIGLNNIADPLFGTLAFAGMAWGLRTRKTAYFALAGAALGLTQYFYDGGRLVYPPLLMAWLVGWGAFELIRIVIAKIQKLNRQDAKSAKEKLLPTISLKGENLSYLELGTWNLELSQNAQNRKQLLWNLTVLLFAAFLIAAPRYTVLAARELPFSQRFDSEGAPLTQLSNLPLALWNTFRIYIQFPDQSYFYRGITPMLLPYVAAAFLIGLAYAAWRALRLDASGLLPLLWLAVVSLGNAMLELPFVAARYVVAFPALALLAGVGLWAAFKFMLTPSSAGWGWQIVARLALALTVGIISVAQVTFYFGVHLPLYNSQARLYYDSQDAAFRSADFPPDTQVHVIGFPPEYHNYATGVMGFLRDDVTMDIIVPDEFTEDYLGSLPRNVDHAFFIAPSDYASQQLIERYFVVEGPFLSPYPLPPNRMLWLYYASRNDNWNG